MKGRISAAIFATTLLVTATEYSPAQCTPPRHRVAIRYADNGSSGDTVRFGWEHGATDGHDWWLCEWELPPPPSGVCGARFLAQDGWGDADYRPYRPGSIDTLTLSFQTGEAGFPFTFTWDTTLVRAAYDSCVIVDLFGGLFHRVRMHESGYLHVSNPAISELLIVVWQRPPSGTPPPTRARLQVSDSGTGVDNLWIGYDPTARAAIDLHLSEFEVPVMPPSGVFFTVLKNPPGHEGADTSVGLGMGSFSDYRTHRSEAAIDTHRIHFQPGSGGYPIWIQWSIDSIRALCDSAIIVDEFGGSIIRKRMDLDSLLTVTNPAFSSALIIRYGQSPLVAIGEVDERPAAEFQLEQNYPNPFNGETRIGYRVLDPGSGVLGLGSRVVRLVVYDVLGREVATLVDGVQEAGMYSVTFSTKDRLPSGVYYYRLVFGGRMETRTMLLVR